MNKLILNQKRFSEQEKKISKLSNELYEQKEAFETNISELKEEIKTLKNAIRKIQ